MSKRFLPPVMVLLGMLAVLFSAPGLASCSPGSEEDRRAVVSACEKMNNLTSFHMTMEIIASTSIQGRDFRMLVNGENDLQLKPLVGKHVMNFTTNIDGKTDRLTIIEYMEETGDRLTIYSNAGGRWLKEVLPAGGLFDEYPNYDRDIKSVVKLSEAGNLAVFEVVSDLSEHREIFSRHFASMKMPQVMADNILEVMSGELKYQLTLDKKTGMVSRIDLDMSELAARLGEIMIKSKDAPDVNREIIKQAFESMSVFLTVKYSRFNAAEKVTIPREARLAK